MYRSQTAVLSAGAGRSRVPMRCSLNARTQVKYSNLNNAEITGESPSEKSTTKDTKRQGEAQGAETSTLFLGRHWRWCRWALLARFALIVHQALPHKVLVIFNVFIKALKLADLEGQDSHQHDNHQ